MNKTPKKTKTSKHDQTHKCPTDIKGFDQITEGGLPKNRITLISGSAGSGKTLFGIDFLIKGAIHYNEPGICMSFEETIDELYKDVASLNLDLPGLVSRKKILLEHVLLERRDIQESDFNLEGLLIRLEHAINSIGAKRVVLDSIESLFAGLTDAGILRLEIKRLFRWLKEKKSPSSLLASRDNVLTLVMAWRSIFPIASFCWITELMNKWPSVEFG